MKKLLIAFLLAASVCSAQVYDLGGGHVNQTPKTFVQAQRSGNVTITSETYTTIVYNSKAYDLNNDYDSGGIFTVPETGYYFVQISMADDGTGSPTRALITLEVPTSTGTASIMYDDRTKTIVDAGPMMPAKSAILYLTKGSKYRVLGYIKATVGNPTIVGNIATNLIICRLF